MATTPVEKKFAVLCKITRAQHFAWRAAVQEVCPEADPAAVGAKMWEVTGHQTAEAYVKRIDPSAPLAPQVARSIAWSSESMGEDAVVELPAEDDRDEAWLRHRDCPWFHWHQRLDLLAEDRPGCDVWLRTVVEDVNQALGTRLRFETLEAMP
ncbi:MAG: hypothetical protein GY856_40365, partial [bacterium]|nr:hypothetical protein [bacterium]